MIDWKLWLTRYDKPQSPHSRRLVTVKRLIDRRIDRLAPHPMSILSICSGDGRDVIQVLADRTDASRVEATLIEFDPRLCAIAAAEASRHGLTTVRIKEADAGVTDTYAEVPLADLVILVGVFGNICDDDVKATIETLPAFCKANALVIWSLRQQRRHDNHEAAEHHPRNDRGRVERVKAWFDVAGFREAFSNSDEAAFFVGAQRFLRETPSLQPGRRFFTFDQASIASESGG